MNIYLLLGASGTGKTTLGNYLKEWGIPELISTTTRQPRQGEWEGNPYYFVTREQFDLIPMIEKTVYNDNLYGTSKAEVDQVLSSGGPAFAIVDRHGISAFQELYGDLCKVIYVWLTPITVLERMRARGDKEREAMKRMRHAIETEEFNNFAIADAVIVNKDLPSSLRQLKAIVEVK